MGLNTQARSTSIGTTPYGVMSGSTTIAPSTTPAVVQLFVDTNAIAAGDEFKFKLIMKIDGSTSRTVYEGSVVPMTNKGWSSPMWIVDGAGWEFTLEKVSGTDRTLPCRVNYVT